MAPGCSAYRPTLPAVGPFHDQPQRTSSEDPAHPHISAEHPQQLELPPLTTTNICGLLSTMQETWNHHLTNFCFCFHPVQQDPSMYYILCIEPTQD